MLEQAKEGWLSKNDPDIVGGRMRMLQSYLQAALRFADHPAVERTVGEFLLKSGKVSNEICSSYLTTPMLIGPWRWQEPEWVPDPDDPEQVLNAIDDYKRLRTQMIAGLFAAGSITETERDQMHEKLDQVFGKACL